MKPSGIILVSPGPVDGYPPVQYQARLFADSGYTVKLVTMPLREDDAAPKFSHPGVDVRCISASAAFGGRISRMRHFAYALWAARRSKPSETIEITYDPIGCFYSDLVPNRPRWRIAHFHELLQRYDTAFLEKRLHTAIHSYDLVVVPDIDRGEHTRRILRLKQCPIVVENYPLRAISRPHPPAGSRGARFEVIYCGVLGLDQKLDAVIRSIPSWPDISDLVLIGNDRTPTATSLRQLAVDLGLSSRVRFLGWMDTPMAEVRLAQADLGVALLDTKSEQWRTALTASNKRFQYMKAGLPQIGDTNPRVPELLEGIGACIQSNHDPAQIAALVTAYASNRLRCAVEGDRAFDRHQNSCNYERAFQPLLDVVRSW